MGIAALGSGVLLLGVGSFVGNMYGDSWKRAFVFIVTGLSVCTTINNFQGFEEFSTTKVVAAYVFGCLAGAAVTHLSFGKDTSKNKWDQCTKPFSVHILSIVATSLCIMCFFPWMQPAK